MIRGAARGLFQSARQVRRAAAKQANKQQKSARASTGRTGGTRRTLCDLAREESIITNQQRQTFGRARYAEAMPRILSVGAVGMLDVGAIDALNVLMQDLAEDDDDGR